MGNGEQRAIYLLKASHQRRAHHAAMAGNPNTLTRQIVRGAHRLDIKRSLGGRKLVCGVSFGVGAAVPSPRRAHDGFEVGEARAPAKLASA